MVIDQQLATAAQLKEQGAQQNPHEIEVMQLEHCGRRTCSQLCEASHTSTVVSVVNNLDSR